MPAHRLGPHIVGRRVVLRRLVPGERGPTGGPAFTDVLGELLAWPTGEDGVAVVRDADGRDHAVPVRLVVSGKPVPPRASVRDRVPPAHWQRVAARSFPAGVTEPLGDWLLRDHEDLDPLSGRGRRVARLSSALAFGDPGLGLAAALDRAVDWYGDRGREPWVAALANGPEHQHLRDAGWCAARGDPPTQTWLGSVARGVRLLDAGPGPARRVRVEIDEPTPGRRRVRVRSDDAVLASGHSLLDPADPDTVGLAGLGTEPDARGRGLGTLAVHALLEDAAARGARTVWLHVLADNAAAHTVYARAGMSAHHEVVYLAPGTASVGGDTGRVSDR